MSIAIIIPTVAIMFTFLLFVLVSTLIGSIIYSGLKGGGHNTGPTYGLGFGAHHPGGIILSDEERQMLKDNNTRYEVILSY